MLAELLAGRPVEHRKVFQYETPLHRAFLRPYAASGFYRPLMALSISLDRAILFEPWLFHTVNVLLHAAVAAAVPWFARVFFELSLSRSATFTETRLCPTA